jgi:hypothetical protein
MFQMVFGELDNIYTTQHTQAMALQTASEEQAKQSQAIAKAGKTSDETADAFKTYSAAQEAKIRNLRAQTYVICGITLLASILIALLG